MRQTKKFVAAMQKTLELGIAARLYEEGQYGVYDRLAGSGYVWNSDSGKWIKSVKGSTMPDSMFIDDEGRPSGIYRVRVWAHVDEIDAALGEVVRRMEGQVLETSAVDVDDTGIGCRVYVTMKLSAESKVKLAKLNRRKEQGQA